MSRTRYPIYIPSKGRWDTPHTARRLTEMGCPFYLVVEETEAAQYRALGLGTVLVLPFHDLGQGSIPARNWIWDHAFAESLREQHPDVVEVTWKFDRWHHQVDYSPFRRNDPKPRADLHPTGAPNEYGMRLVRVGTLPPTEESA